ncbi:MAG: hypothetical protein JRE43_03740 [Deltaproteobacteria bacterium]|jgi:hypothetical protein|nr:hypothetical protein [Deltaproteobacteria bacterium]MBW2542589.1 hypothetical protein [Deltaproteobacteria bacterium]
MCRIPILHLAVILMFAAGLPSGCTHPGEEGAAVPAKKGVAKQIENPPQGPFGYSLIATETGAALEIGDFAPYEDCADCHERQWEEMEGSVHTIAHTDPLYRSTAELARREAGEEIYTYCSGCHSPQGVTTGLIPGTPEAELPEVAKAGILCDVCHQVSRLTGTKGPWGEPGNASLVLSPDEDRKFGPPVGDDAAADHVVETREFLDRSEFCASCHTIIHPLNGLRLEHTYGEWKKSVYAKKGIQCQDCHMRSVEDAVRVAETLSPIAVLGRSEPSGALREIHPHQFEGGNSNLEVLGGSATHASMAEARLKSAARLEIDVPSAVRAGADLEFEVLVHNVAAGHALPTSLTELREMWVALEVRAADDRLLFQSGQLASDGEIPAGAMRFGAIAGDAKGNVTYKPWEVSQFLSKRLIPARGSASDRFRVDLPDGIHGPVRIAARLFYRSASPRALASLMGDEAFEAKQVEMASAEASIAVRQ